MKQLSIVVAMLALLSDATAQNAIPPVSDPAFMQQAIGALQAQRNQAQDQAATLAAQLGQARDKAAELQKKADDLQKQFDELKAKHEPAAKK